jgi:hypothetical protein
MADPLTGPSGTPVPTAVAGLARILDSDGVVVGAGWQLAPDVVATCAHVVATAVGADPYGPRPTAEVWLDLPFEPDPSPAHRATLYGWVPIQQDGSGDVALLRLRTSRGTAPSIAFRSPEALWDRPFRVLGFPAGEVGGADGIWTSGQLRGHQGAGLCQLQTAVGRPEITPGFSGAPVWVEDGCAVAGLTVVGDPEVGSHTAYLVPIEQILAADPGLMPCPYPGLAAFDEHEAAFFHGRRAATDEVLARVRSTDLVLVAGGSGAGKSSLVRAGVVPVERARGTDVRMYRVRGDGTLEQTSGSTAATGQDPADAIRTAREDRDVLVVLDQFEELASADQAAAVALLSQCAALLESRPRVRLLVTVRWESMAALSTPEMSERLGAGTVFLHAMSRDELRVAITRPAARVPGLTFEAGLVDTIVDAAGTEPGRLPLVEALLQLLWERREGAVLTTRAYWDVGGLAGAVARLADDAVSGLGDGAARLLFCRMVAVDHDTGRFRRRMASVASLPAEERALVSQLVAARVLVRSAQSETVELAHQSLIDNWPRLQAWLAEDRDFVVWQAEADERRRRWEEATEDDGALLRGAALTTAVVWQDSRDREMSEPLRHFIGRSLARRRRDRRRLQIVAAVLAVLVVLAGSLAVLAEQRASNISTELTAANAAALGQTSRELALTDPAASTQFALSAFASDPSEPKAQAAILDRHLAQQSVERTHPHITAKPIRSLQQSSDGTVLALGTATGTVLINGPSGPDPRRHELGDVPGSSFQLAPNGRRGLSSAPDGTVQLWDLESRSATVLFRAGPRDPRTVVTAFSANGRYVGMLLPDSASTRLTVWDIGEGTAVENWARDLPYRVPPVTLERLWITDDGRSATVALQTFDEQAFTSISSLDTWAAASTDPESSLVDRFPTGQLHDRYGLSADAADQYTCDIARSGSTLRIERRIDRSPLHAIDMPMLGLKPCGEGTTDGDHLLFRPLITDGPTSVRSVIVSLRTGRAFNVTLPLSPTDLGWEPGSADFPRADPLIAAVDEPDGSLTAHVARGDSVYRLRGTPDWLALNAEFGVEPMLSADRRYGVVERRDGSIHVHGTASGAELTVLPAAEVPQSSLGLNRFNLTGQVLTHVRVEGQVVRYVERTLPDLQIRTELTLPADPTDSRPQVITTEDRVIARTGNDGNANRILLSVFDRRTGQQIGETAQLGDRVRWTPGQERAQMLLIDPADPNRVLVTDSTGKLVLWSLSDEEQLASSPVSLLRTSNERPVAAFDPYQDRIAVLDADRILRMLDADTLREVGAGVHMPGTAAVLGVTPDGLVLLERGEFTIPTDLLFWNVAEGVPVGTVPLVEPRPTHQRGGEVHLVSDNIAPHTLATDSRAWFAAVCATDSRPMTRSESALVPAGASTGPCVR